MASVRLGNVLAVRSCILLLLGHLGGVGWTVEQPTSSLLPWFPPVARLFALAQPTCTSTYLGAFGSATVKPVRLWSTRAWVSCLKRVRPKGVVDPAAQLVKRSGRRVTGIRSALKASQAYPQEFAIAGAMARLHASRADRGRRAS